MSSVPNEIGLAPDTSTFEEQSEITLHRSIEAALNRYFRDMDGHLPSDLYQLMLSEMERPLLTYILNYTRGNQSKAAEILGINRGTLRKKLKDYNIA